MIQIDNLVIRTTIYTNNKQINTKAGGLVKGRVPVLNPVAN